MHCADSNELMDEVLDGRAGSERKAALLAHVADCAACRAEWSAIQKIDHLLAAAPLVSPPTDFTVKVMARLPRRQPARHPWAGAVALFAGTGVISLMALFAFTGVSILTESAGLLGGSGGVLLQLSSTFISWLQAGWEIRQAMITLVPPGLVVLYALVSLAAVVAWLGLVAGVQGVLRPAGQ